MAGEVDLEAPPVQGQEVRRRSLPGLHPAQDRPYARDELAGGGRA
jgi:hypothetical protein